VQYSTRDCSQLIRVYSEKDTRCITGTWWPNSVLIKKFVSITAVSIILSVPCIYQITRHHILLWSCVGTKQHIDLPDILLLKDEGIMFLRNVCTCTYQTVWCQNTLWILPWKPNLSSIVQKKFTYRGPSCQPYPNNVFQSTNTVQSILFIYGHNSVCNFTNNL
jgi:hypothetical protein